MIQKNCIILLVIIVCLTGCKNKGDHSNIFYEFIVENNSVDKVVKIVPKVPFRIKWITNAEEYIIKPGYSIIIANENYFDENKQMIDKYKPDDQIIDEFDLYINDVKQENVYNKRSFWHFSMPVDDEIGRYILKLN